MITRALTAALCAAGLAALASAQDQVTTPERVRPERQQQREGLKVGDTVADFTLKDLSDKEHTLSKYLEDGHVVVLEWFNPDCPVVQRFHADEDNRTMAETAAALKEEGVVWLAINSGAKDQQGAGAERNKKAVKDYHIEYPLLLDETGIVGRAYGAKVTPHIFIVSTEGKLVYQGGITENAAPYREGMTNYVLAALKQHLAGEKVEHAETRPNGCSVKYGRAPEGRALEPVKLKSPKAVKPAGKPGGRGGRGGG